VDISDPDTPTIVTGSPYATASNAYDVVVVGSYAYVAAHTAGLQIFDVSDPENCAAVTSLSTTDTARELAVQGSCAYIADYSGGLQVIQLF
jgi:hypothetical protein